VCVCVSKPKTLGDGGNESALTR